MFQKDRFRKEKDFWLMNIRWANTIEITNDEAIFFLDKQKAKQFVLDDFKTIGSIEGYQICYVRMH